MPKKKELKPLTPVDPKRCQVDVPNGATAFTCGGVPGRVRCSNVPTVVATERKPGKDGRIGSMSLCDSCLEVFQKQMPVDFATIMTVGAWKKGLKDTDG